MRVPNYDKKMAAKLINERSEERMRAWDVESKAHRRWDLKEYENAAVLFCAAAERYQFEFDAGQHPKDQAPSDIVRAAINFNLAGRHEIAEPILREAIAFDWIGAGLKEDSHMVEWSYFELLKNSLKFSSTSFDEIFEEAIGRCQELGMSFPFIHAKQEFLLNGCLAHGFERHIPLLVERIKCRRPISREARTLIKKAEQRLALN